MIMIRRLQPGEAHLFKQLRLRALQDSPDAFSSTYERAIQRNAESWHEQAESSARGSDRATFIAFNDDLAIGMAALYRGEDTIDVGELLQVWVSPEHRGTQVIWKLMDEIFIWASENRFHEIIAGVTKGNDRAVKFYTKYGFSMMEESSEGVLLLKQVSLGRSPG